MQGLVDAQLDVFIADEQGVSAQATRARSTETRVRVDRLLKLIPTVWPCRAERVASDWGPALMADLAGFCTNLVSSDGVRSAIVRKWRWSAGAVERCLLSERVMVERLRGGMVGRCVERPE